MERDLQLTDNVRLAGMDFGTPAGYERYTVYCRDPWGELADEIDLDAGRFATKAEIDRAAKLAVQRELVEGCTVDSVTGPRTGLYL